MTSFWFCGCGGSPKEAPFSAPPHGGNIVYVPDSQIVVELKTDTVAPAKGGRKEPVKSQIFAYFYDANSASAVSPAPSDVKVTLGADSTGMNVSLAAQSSEPGQFASAPGDYPDQLRGKIEFQQDGKPREAKFSFR